MKYQNKYIFNICFNSLYLNIAELEPDGAAHALVRLLMFNSFLGGSEKNMTAAVLGFWESGVDVLTHLRFKF